jgi:DNA polymerase elongation subunit (family B)
MRINNLYSDKRDIYVFSRNDNCELKINKFVGFFPYFYEPDLTGQFVSFKGEKLRKLIVSNPADIRKQASPRAFEADILFVKRFMVDKVDVIDKAPVKYSLIDVETLSPEMPNVQEAKYPISCISIYNSLSKEIKTFYLPDYESEYMMLVAFTTYMKKEKFDIWFSWNVKFDYNYLYNRTLSIFDLEGIKNADLAECISSIDKSRYGDGEVKYPAGTSIVDYLMWFKKITLGREKMYTLDYIAQKFLKVPPKAKVDFSKLTPELKQHNIDDVKLMVGLEEQMNLVSYYDEIRRITQVEWEDFEFNSRSIDMLLLKEAKQRNLVLPNRPTGEGEEEVFEGAFRDIYETGRLENIGKADLSSAYPYAIIEFCLDPANVVPESGANIIPIGDNYFKQDSKALIPTIIKKLLVLKATIKKELSDCSIDDPNHKNIKLKYDAIKSLCNTAYGVTALKFFRLFDVRVASATTFVVRSLLHYIKDKLDGSGHQVVYIDTDGVFYKNPSEEINIKLNGWIQQWVKETFKKESVQISFDFEGVYESILLLAKCRYVGRLRKNNGELEIETKGIEAKRKDSTKYMGNFQKILIDKILDNEPKEKIYNWIKEEIKNFPKQNIIDIAFPCKMAKAKIEYKSVPIFSRALDNTPEFKTRVGDNFYYIYMLGKEKTND